MGIFLWCDLFYDWEFIGKLVVVGVYKEGVWSYFDIDWVRLVMRWGLIVVGIGLGLSFVLVFYVIYEN